MIKVFLREKKLLHGKRGLYLDFYPPIVNPDTMKPTRREHLKLFIYEKPKTEEEREHNKETKMLGESIKAQRQLELQAGAYGFVASQNRRKDFIEYFKSIRDSKKKNSRSNQRFWNALYQHLINFAGEQVRFGDVTDKFCRDFKDYLRFNAGIEQNTAAGYFAVFKAVINQAAERKMFAENPVKKVKRIELEEKQREFLTLEELQRLAETDCKSSILKNAALFSALTGLRFSDVRKLTWREIHQSKQQGFYIRFVQQKTKGAETLPISDEAVNLLGERSDPDEKIFKGLMPWQCVHILPKWISAAGIDRKIGFHSFRHTYATLQLTLGTDIYTVSKMLGHRKLQTTQIYAKVIDQKKREAANKIKLK